MASAALAFPECPMLKEVRIAKLPHRRDGALLIGLDWFIVTLQADVRRHVADQLRHIAAVRRVTVHARSAGRDY